MEIIIIKVRATREPYRRAGLSLGRDTKSFSVEVKAPLKDEQIDPKWGKYCGDITAEQAKALSEDDNVLLERVETEVEDAAPDALPMDEQQREAITELIAELGQPLVDVEGFKVNKTNAKKLLPAIREGLSEAEHPADKLSSDVDGETITITAAYGAETVTADITVSSGGAD